MFPRAGRVAHEDTMMDDDGQYIHLVGPGKYSGFQPGVQKYQYWYVVKITTWRIYSATVSYCKLL